MVIGDWAKKWILVDSLSVSELGDGIPTPMCHSYFFCNFNFSHFLTKSKKIKRTDYIIYSYLLFITIFSHHFKKKILAPK